MTTRSTKKKADYCDPPKGILCPEIIELRVIVKNIGDAVLNIEHLILGNGKEGMKVEQSRQSELIKEMDKKMDMILAEQKLVSDERIARLAREKQEKEIKKLDLEREKEKSANKQWTFRWLLGLLFDKFSAPIVVAIILYFMLGGK